MMAACAAAVGRKVGADRTAVGCTAGSVAVAVAVSDDAADVDHTVVAAHKVAAVAVARTAVRAVADRTGPVDSHRERLNQ